jgi:hypothetical protein
MLRKFNYVNIVNAGPTWHVADISELGYRITAISGKLRREKWAEAECYIEDAWDSLEIFAKNEGLDFEECCAAAWNEIKDRKGMMVNGSYVKYEDFTDEQRLDFMNRESPAVIGPTTYRGENKDAFCVIHSLHYDSSFGCLPCNQEREGELNPDD